MTNPTVVSEAGQTLWVSPETAAALVRAGLVYYCSECDQYHHEDFERWDEVRAIVNLATAVFVPPEGWLS